MLKKELCIFIIIFLFSLGIRLYSFDFNKTFSSSDETNTLLASIDATKIFQAQSFDELSLHITRLFSYAWGPMVILITSTYLLFLKILGFSITEAKGTLIFLFFGSITPPTFYLLIKKLLKNRMISFLSATTLAVLPIHVALSRSMGSSIAISSFFLIISILMFIKFLQERNLLNLILLSTLFSFYVLSDPQFLGIIIIFLVLFFHLKNNNQSIILKYKDILIFFCVFLLIISPILILFIHYAISGDIYGGYIGHLFSKKKVLGLHTEFFDFFYLNNGSILTIILFIGGVYGSYYILRKRFKTPEIVLFSWSLIYLLPWLILVSPDNADRVYYTTSTIPLISLFYIFVSRLTDYLRSYYKRIILAIIFLLIILSTIHYLNQKIYSINAPHFYGKLEQNTGIKTAGFWIRNNTKESTIILSEFGIPPQLYYFHRNILTDFNTFWSFNSANESERNKFIKENFDKAEFVVIKSNNLLNEYIQKDNLWWTSVKIRDINQDLITIYSRNKTNLSILNISIYDAEFDRNYGNLESLHVDCYFCKTNNFNIQ